MRRRFAGRRAAPGRALAVLMLLLAACGDPAGAVDSGTTDAGAADAAAVDAAAADGAPADGRPADAPAVDGAPADGAPADGPLADARPPDARPPDARPPDAAGADAPPPDAPGPTQAHVDIHIDNFCHVSASPASFDVPAGATLQLAWHNNSVDYEADVWLSYGGGYLQLARGAVWSDPFTFCSMPTTYDAYGDVSIAGGPSSGCPGFRVWIHCQ